MPKTSRQETKASRLKTKPLLSRKEPEATVKGVSRCLGVIPCEGEVAWKPHVAWLSYGVRVAVTQCEGNVTMKPHVAWLSYSEKDRMHGSHTV